MNHIAKLASSLILVNIPFQVKAQKVLKHDYPQIFVPSAEAPIIDVICNPYSYGGEEGLLEIGYRDENDEVCDVVGYLTGDEAAALVMERMGIL